jgi:uncharacterized membrane protein YidH (DUF202 family)
MTLKTLGMGVAKFLKTKGNVVKKEFVSPKTNIPLYVAGAAVTAGKIAYEKVKTKIKESKKGKK